MPVPAEFQALLEGVSARDRVRLGARLRRLSRAGEGASPAELAALRGALEAAAARRAQRAARVPPIHVPPELPIASRAEEIVAAIRRHQVLVLAGETGSGKTTQLPKLCLLAGRGSAGLIGCTQPRRLAARSMARRVAAELGDAEGRLVGWQVRFSDRVGEDALVKFMTDGILLAETQSDRDFLAYDTLILDEAHERSLNIDFLLGYLQRVLPRRPDLKLIVTSATIDTARFARHFGNAPVIEVAGRGHPVEVCWRGPLARAEAAGAAQGGEADPLSVAEQVAAVLDEISAEDPRGDVLVFLPGEREIRDVHRVLARRAWRATEILALYARLSAAEQDRVFHPGAARRIVLATNVAETSLTVPRIRYVIDSGTARVKRYNPRTQLERLHVEPISQAAADQRKGRCGRLGPGICYRLYDESDWTARPRYTDPEILRSSLAGVILRMLVLRLGEPASFPFLEPPAPRALADGFRRLAELGAIDGARQLTATGRRMAALPIDVALARMLVEAGRLGVRADLLVLAAFLSIQDPRERPAEARTEADAAHAAFAVPGSDFAGILKLWEAYTEAHRGLTQARLRDWCREHFLSFLRMREWRELHRQLLLLGDAEEARGTAEEVTDGTNARRATDDPAEKDGLGAARYEAIHRCLLSGGPTQVGRRDPRGLYGGPRERKFAVFPGSVLAKPAPQWLLAGQILDLGRVYGMFCARVEPAWIEAQAAHLVRRSWRDVHWSRRQGRVVASEQVSLFGLSLVEARRIGFAAQDPAQAHAVFLREGLARCEVDGRAAFLRHNARVLAEAVEREAKYRRSGLLRNEEQRAAFFAGKLPQEIASVAGLDAWHARASEAERAALLWTLDDLLEDAGGRDAAAFPASLAVAGQKLRLEYRFVPGDPADGVTLRVPLALVNAVPAGRCEWLVPGLLEEKVASAIRALPKALRRNFVPAPEFARAFAAAESPRDESLWVVLARWLARVTGVAVAAAEFAALELPVHLRMNFRIHDGEGRLLVESRDLGRIQSEWGDAARLAFTRHLRGDIVREEVTAAEFPDVPERLVSASGLVAWPALVDLGETVALQVFEHREEALAAHRAGVVRLLRQALAPEIKRAMRQLPLARDTLLGGARQAFRPGDPGLRKALDAVRGEGVLLDAGELRADLVEAALRECLAAEALDLRTRGDFERVRRAIARNLFPAAMARLGQAEAILAARRALLPLLEPPLLGFAAASFADLRGQLDELLAPGFLWRQTRERLAQFPRYLEAMQQRARGIVNDPTRDQSRLLGIAPYRAEYLRLRGERGADDPGVQELRWALEELRVASFAQGLGTPVPISPKRVRRLIDALDAAS